MEGKAVRDRDFLWPLVAVYEPHDWTLSVEGLNETEDEFVFKVNDTPYWDMPYYSPFRFRGKSVKIQFNHVEKFHVELTR